MNETERQKTLKELAEVEKKLLDVSRLPPRERWNLLTRRDVLTQRLFPFAIEAQS